MGKRSRIGYRTRSEGNDMKNFVLASALMIVARVAQLEGSGVEFAVFGLMGTVTMMNSVESWLRVSHG